MLKTKIKTKILIALLAVSAEAAAFAPTNLYRPYDAAARLPHMHH